MRKGMEATLFVLILLFMGLLAGCGGAPFDPNLAAIQEQQQAQLHGAMATGTMEAKILPITQTSAAFSFSATQVSVQMTQAAALWTPTASPVPTITQTPTPNVQSTSTFAALFAIQTQTTLNIQQKQTTSQFYAIVLPLFIIALLFAIPYAAVTYSRLVRRKPLPRDDFGKVSPVMDIVSGETYDLSASPNYSHITKSLFEQIVIQWLERKYGFIPEQPHITISRMDHTKDREQDIESERYHRSRRLLDDRKGQLLLTQPSADLSSKFLLPDWDIINGWDGKNGLPYYTANGLETFSIDKVPHLSVTGETGSGKTRRFLRPLIACALAAGYRVVIIGKSKDYSVFKHHPNADLIGINNVLDPEQALRYANILSAVVEEMNRRDEVLTSKNKSIWSEAGYIGTIIVCDEIGNSLNIMDKANRAAANQTRAWAEGLVAEGRAVGLHMWFGSQRATGMLGIYSQTRKAIFRVAPDEEAQHRSMAGASTLDDGYYLAKFSASKLAGGFEPSDEQIHAFLNSRQVSKSQNSEDEWIEGVIMDQPTLPVREPTKQITQSNISTGEFVHGLHEWEAEVLDLHEKGLDQETIVAKVFAGDNPEVGKAAVADLIQRWRVVKGSVESPVIVSEQPAVKSEIVQMAEAIRAKWTPGLSLNKTSQLLGKPYEGNSWCSKVKQVVDYLTTTTTNENRAISPDFGAVVA